MRAYDLYLAFVTGVAGHDDHSTKKGMCSRLKALEADSNTNSADSLGLGTYQTSSQPSAGAHQSQSLHFLFNIVDLGLRARETLNARADSILSGYGD